jgi:hypothetical protein
MPVVSSGGRDLCSQICLLGFFFLFASVLLRLELGVEERDAARLNKTVLCRQVLQLSDDTAGHPLAGHGGEGRRQAAVSSSGVEPWWRDLWILQTGAAVLPLTGRGGEGKKSSSSSLCRSGASGCGGAGVAPGWSKISAVFSPSTSTVVGQLLQIAGSSSSALLQRPDAVLVPTSMAVRQPLPPCSPVCRRVMFFLQACVPMWRSSGFEAMCSRCCAPSGFVPGGSAVDRARKSCHGCGGGGASGSPGSDCFFFFFLRAFVVICRDLVVLSLSVEVSFVKFPPPPVI